MKHAGAVLLALLLPATASAQDDFEAFRRREAQNLRAFLTKEDADFSDFLKQEWKQYQLSIADKPLVRPKPRETPVAPVRDDAPSNPPRSVPDPAPRPDAPADPPSVSVVPAGGALPSASSLPGGRQPMGTPPVAPRPIGANMLGTAFFGSVVPIPKVDLALDPMPSPITTAAVSRFWEQINAAKYGDVLTALQRQREQMQLGDWAFAQLAYRAGLDLTRGDSTLARLVSWHFLVKSGYVSRVGFNGDRLFVLLRTDELLYGVPYFTLQNARFYVLDLGTGIANRVGSIHTYERDHPEAKKPVSFHMASLPLLPEQGEARTLKFSYKGQNYSVGATVNRNLISFLTYYPQHQLNGYLDAEVPSSAMDALVNGLRPIISGRPEREQVEMILRFVQTAFEYKTDGDQFQREKWMFPEETLFYPFSDCEDRAILFSYLARKLVPSVTVVGLIYADHIATAVRFSAAVPGDTRLHKGVRYVVADPTYIGADVGMEMPQYKNATPTIVDARPFGR